MIQNFETLKFRGSRSILENRKNFVPQKQPTIRYIKDAFYSLFKCLSGLCPVPHSPPAPPKSTPTHTHTQERQGSDVFSDSLLLREMAEELRRDHRQHGAKAEETGGSGLQQEVEPNKENHSFQNVLK